MTYATFEQLSQSRRNNFNFLRFFLALLVIFDHSFLLLPPYNLQEPVTRLTRGQMTAGSWAVQGFFIISGFLIMQSWERRPNLAHFLKNRALRIYPGWIAALLFCVLVVAPLSGINLGVLLHNPQTAVFFVQLLLHASSSLPKVFAGNPVPNVVDGSLWTIPLEILCYFAAALCGLVLSSQKPGSPRWAVPALFVIGLIAVKFPQHAHLHSVPWFGNLEAFPFYGTCFLAGMMLQQFQKIVPVSWPLFLACLGVMGLAALRKQGMAIPFILCGSYALLFTAFLPFGLSRFGERFDLSYGIYLYAYPVQQLIVKCTEHRIMPMGLFMATVPLTLALALASWCLIERPFLRLKKRIPTAPPAAISETSSEEKVLS